MFRQAIKIPKYIRKHFYVPHLPEHTTFYVPHLPEHTTFYVPHLPEHTTFFTINLKKSKYTEHD